jgi:hypothetical protein
VGVEEEKIEKPGPRALVLKADEEGIVNVNIKS